MDRSQRGLFDSDQDLAAWLARMTAPAEPQTFDYTHSFAPGVQARINAQVQPPSIMPSQVQQAMPSQISPSLGLQLGPLSLSGGLQPQGDGSLRPTIGAGLKVPLPGDATGEAKFSYTPEQLKLLEAAYSKKLWGGDLSIQGNYGQPAQGDPTWGVSARYRRRF